MSPPGIATALKFLLAAAVGSGGTLSVAAVTQAGILRRVCEAIRAAGQSAPDVSSGVGGGAKTGGRRRPTSAAPNRRSP